MATTKKAIAEAEQAAEIKETTATPTTEPEAPAVTLDELEGMDVIPYRLQVMHFEIYLPHPATLTKEDNHHSDYGGQQQEVPGIYLLCQGYFHC